MSRHLLASRMRAKSLETRRSSVTEEKTERPPHSLSQNTVMEDPELQTLEILENYTEVYAEGKNSLVGEELYEIKTAKGDVLLSGPCHYSMFGGWPKDRFRMNYPNGDMAFTLKGEKGQGVNIGSGLMETTVFSPNKEILGILKGSFSDIDILAVTNDVLAEVNAKGIFGSKDLVIKLRTGKGKGNMENEWSYSFNKYKVEFPPSCPANIKLLLVATALELICRENQDKSYRLRTLFHSAVQSLTEKDENDEKDDSKGPAKDLNTQVIPIDP